MSPSAALDVSQPVSRQLPRAERRAVILHAAARAFAESGYAATSMEDIAAASGVTKVILYRHFDGKEALYRAVLERVSGRLAGEFAGALEAGRQRGFTTRTFLTVAREDPDAFRLLWRHAAREPEFAEYASQFRELAVGAARSLLAEVVTDRSLHRWAGETIVGFVVEAVINWVDGGEPDRDAEFVELTTSSIQALVGALADAP